jgi:hypothetical protein
MKTKPKSLFENCEGNCGEGSWPWPRRRLSWLLLSVQFCLMSMVFCLAQTSSFSYQGRLNEDNQPANGNFELTAELYDAPEAGHRIGQLVVPNVVVNNGLFEATLDFGTQAFDGNPRWLELAIRRPGGDLSSVRLTPRQPIRPAPYAMHAFAAGKLLNGLAGDGSRITNLQSSQLSGTIESELLSSNIVRSDQPASSTNLISLLNADLLDGKHASDLWALRGNAGTQPETNFIGTTDAQPLVFKANGRRMLRLELNQSVVLGTAAKSQHDGAFVWADSSSTNEFASSRAQEFRVRSTGGAVFTVGHAPVGQLVPSVSMTATGGVAIISSNVMSPALDVRQGSLKVSGAGLGSKTPVFIHRASPTNMLLNGNFTVIDHPLCNNDPNAILIVVPNANPGDTTGTNYLFQSAPIGVYYTGNNATIPAFFRNKWSIILIDLRSMWSLVSFNVLVIKP